jgi:hypothetical protein
VNGAGASKLGWYARRLRRMSPAEMAWRVREQAVRRAWARRQVRPGDLDSLPPLAAARPAAERRFTAVLPLGAAAQAVPGDAASALIADADRLLMGEWEMLGVLRTDMERPDWFRDPASGRRSAPDAYAFSLNQRDESAVGNIKQVWEVNRLQHLTLLAAAWYLTGVDAYAERVADQLRSWWRENPFLSGINWTSGIELGVRLINLAWIRRLLDGWPGVSELFELNDLAVRQIYWHQQYLAAFESRGSSANNHVIAEAAGQLAASCAFPWYTDSERWRRDSSRLLERELERNTFPSGVNRELASDYHGFVAELGFFAAIEASAAGTPLSDSAWKLLCAMTDCMAALVDEQGRPPRQGDSDEGRVVVIDAPKHNRWPALLALGGALFGQLDWWPQVEPDVPLPRCWSDHSQIGRDRRARDLVPVRRRAAWLPVDRRPRSRGRAFRGGQVRRRGRPGRPGHLLLSRRTRMAVLLPLDDRAQHGRDRRSKPVGGKRPVHVVASFKDR